MHGLINAAIQSFVSHTYGRSKWVRVMQRADMEFTDFEAMLIYEDDDTRRVLDAAAGELGRPRAEVLEDLGTYLVSNPNVESLRRLLRFGGVTYVEFLHSLDELPDRARLAVSDLDLPALELHDHGDAQFNLICHPGIPGYGSVMLGILRAMADDYGALAILDHITRPDRAEEISISLVEASFSEGRSFQLGARTG
ncbi:MAG: heme NO-binding domain-containing protein [Rhodobacteraceae bacterium]|nr:heme NO-binding domain-containing protein [Paracoccaceae bacterium]